MKRPRTQRGRLLLLSGWLFADLFLLLMIVGLSQVSTPRVPPPPLPSPHSTTPSSTRMPPPGLDPDHVDFAIRLSPDRFRGGGSATFVRLVNAALARAGAARRRVGFVLVFASGAVNDIGRAQRTATRAVAVLHARSPAFTRATGLGYWNGNRGDFELKVFFLN